MNEFQKFLLALLGPTLQMPESAVASLFDAEGKPLPTAVQTVLSLDAQRISRIETEAQTRLDNAVREAKANLKGQELGIYERNLKAKVGITSEKKGEELWQEIVDKLTSKEITDAQVQAHPAFIRMDDAYKQQLAAKEQEKSTALDGLRASISAQDAERNVRAKALVIFRGLNPIFPSTRPEVIASHEQSTMDAVFQGIKVRVDNAGAADENIVLLNEAGTEVLKDAHGNRILLQDRVRQIASSRYDFKAAPDRDAPPDPAAAGGAGGGSGSGGGATFDLTKQLTALGLKVPTSMKEWSAVYSAVTKTDKLPPLEQTKLLAELGKFSKTLEGK